MRLFLKNLLRTPVRTGLTICGTAVALFLFCLLETVLAAFHAGVAMSSASRLLVQHKASLTFFLPSSHRARIERTAGVKRAAPATWFGGIYEEPLPGGGRREEFFANFAVDLESYLAVYPEIEIPPAQRLALMNDLSGCVIGDKLAERLGKRLGDRIVLRGTIFGRPDNKPWDFLVRAIYTSASETFDRTMMIYHARCLEEASPMIKGRMGIFIVELDDPARAAEVSAAIDAQFANSPYETLTMSEKAFNLQFVQMIGNLELLLRSIGGVVLLTMLLISANTMMMSVRERTREMGILKSLGFSGRHVFSLLLGEALVVSFLAAILGAGGAWLLINVGKANPKPDFFPIFRLPELTLLWALGLALLTGLASGLAPALAGLRLKPVEALRSL